MYTKCRIAKAILREERQKYKEAKAKLRAENNGKVRRNLDAYVFL